MERDRGGTKELFEYFRINSENRRKEIEEALLYFQTVPRSFCAACSFKTNKFIHLSSNVESFLGHPIDQYLNHGYHFLFQLIPSNVIAELMAWQSELIKMMTSPSFDYTTPLFIEFEGALLDSKNSLTSTYQSGVVLEYEPGADCRTFFSLWIEVSRDGKIPISKATLRRKLKEFHRLLLGPVVSTKNPKINPDLIRIKAPHFQAPTLTRKEKEILLLLAKGMPLKAIADKMKVSYFTSETHRKNLFRKFNVRNVAELIQKATKVYWME